MSEISSPYELMHEIERDARALDTGGRQLARAIRDLGPIQQSYEMELQKQKIKLFDDAKATGERMPGEDLRNALAHREVPSDVWDRYIAKKAEVDALRAWTRTIESALSAKQSLLNAMKAELRAA